MGRPKSDLLRGFGAWFAFAQAVTAELLALGGTDEDVRFFLNNKKKLAKEIAVHLHNARIGAKSKPANIEYVVALADTDVPEQYAQALANWRKLAASLGYNGPVAWRVQAGFTLKSHAPKAGHCYDKFNYLQGWSLQNDEPTQDAIVFWVPRLMTNSTSKTVTEQKAQMARVRRSFELPEHHLTNFGSAALLAALVLAHFKAIGERVPLGQLYARSDTLHVDGYRLNVGLFDDTGLFCNAWSDVSAYSNVGWFALGVGLGL